MCVRERDDIISRHVICQSRGANTHPRDLSTAARLYCSAVCSFIRHCVSVVSTDSLSLSVLQSGKQT